MPESTLAGQPQRCIGFSDHECEETQMSVFPSLAGAQLKSCRKLTGLWGGSFRCGPSLLGPRFCCPSSQSPRCHSRQQTGCSLFPAWSHRRRGRSHRCRDQRSGVRHWPRDRAPQRAQPNNWHAYLARVRPMPLSANLGTRAGDQSTPSLGAGRKGPVPWGRTAAAV